MKDRRKADIDLPATDIAVVASQTFDEVLIIAEKVDHPPSGPRRSGKTIHLRVTRKQAMMLLAGQETVRKALNLPPVPEALAEYVPPPDERQ